MANEQHLEQIKQGTTGWNTWRRRNPEVCPDLNGADLQKIRLEGADLRGVNFCGADLREAYLREADLGGAILDGAEMGGADVCSANLHKASLVEANLGFANLDFAYLREADFRGASLWEAKLIGADLRMADLGEANLRGANLTGAVLREANLAGADLSGANFSQANLSMSSLVNARMVETNFERAMLSGCSVYGITAWSLQLEGAAQDDLVLTPASWPTITIDSLEVAQFTYLLLHSRKIAEVVNGIHSNFVLVLGCFTPGREAHLDAIREQLRLRGYSPVSLDFDRPAEKEFWETVAALTQLCRFVIADITGSSVMLQEFQSMAADFPPVPLKMLREESPGTAGSECALESGLCLYSSVEDLVMLLPDNIIAPAEARAQSLWKERFLEPAY